MVKGSEDSAEISRGTETVLQAWRAKVLNLVLTAVAVISLPAVISVLVESVFKQDLRIGLFLYPAFYCGILALALFRRLDLRIRGWGLLLVGYANGILGFRSRGLAGSGPLYIMSIPIAALVLLGVPAGWICVGVSMAILLTFALLSDAGVLERWLVVHTIPLTLDMWLTPGLVWMMLMVSLMAVLTRFYHFLLDTLAAERQASQALAQANVRLEDYNRTLVTRVAQRTAALEAMIDEAQSLNAQLESEIAERKLVEQALRKRTLELESSNHDLDAFAHTVAHDLKNPLTSLVGYSGLLASDPSTISQENQRDYLQLISQLGCKIADIVDALLLLSSVRRLDDVYIEPLDMAAIVKEALIRLDDLVEARQADIVVPETWPAAVGYAPWVEAVWVNYVSNAVKYGGRQDAVAPHIELGYDPLSEVAQIRFWVSDNGKGIPPVQIAQLFKLFSRLDSNQEQGHGLGLSIAKRIVEKLDGQVGVESTLNVGSRFWFTLPSYSEPER